MSKNTLSNKILIKKTSSSCRPLALIGLYGLMLSPLNLQAAEIIINDCTGITRAQITLSEQSEKKNLTVGLEDKASSASKLVLKSEGVPVGSGVVVADVKNQEAYFSDLGSGVYEVCPESGTAQFSTVHFHSNEESVLKTAGLGAIGVASVAGSIIALGSGGSDSSNNPTGSTLTQVSAETTGSTLPAVSGAPSSVRPSTDAAKACLNGSKLNPISPFE